MDERLKENIMIKKLSTLSGVSDIRSGVPLSANIMDYDVFQVSISGTPGHPYSDSGWASSRVTYSQLTANLSATLENAEDLRYITLSSDGTNPVVGDTRVPVGEVESHVLTLKTVGDALTLSGSSDGSTIILSGTDKYAIVPSKDEGFVSLACVEMPETRFEDIYTIDVPEVYTKSVTIAEPIDDEFIFVCEPDSIDVISYTSDEPATLGVKIVDNYLVVKLYPVDLCPTKVTVKISGIRKGRKGVRFVKWSQEEYDNNTKFWNGWQK